MAAPPSPESSIISVLDSRPTKSKSELKAIVTWIRLQWRAVMCELIATTLMVILGCMTCLPINGEYPPALYIALGFGLIIFVNVQIFSHISGAHMNPFVSVIAVIFEQVSITTAIAFVIAQCIGSTLGYGILMNITYHDIVGNGICLLIPHPDLSGYQAVFIEMLLAGTLSLMICALWDPANALKQDSVPLKFGFTIVALCIAGAPLTGCCMNPARALGPALWLGKWDSQWVYWVGPMIGGILSAVFYKYVLLTKPDILHHEPQKMEME